MKSPYTRMLAASAFLLGTVIFHAGPAQAAFVTQLDITGGSLSFNFRSLGSVSGSFTQNGQLVMGQYQPLPNIFPPITVGGHTFSLFTSDQAFSGFPAGAPAPTGMTSGSTITVDLRSLFAGVAGPFMNGAVNIGEPATGTFNPATNTFDIAWSQPFTGLGLLTSGSFSLRGTAQVTTAPVPLPAGIILFGSGLCGIVGIVIRRQGPLQRQDLGSGSAGSRPELTRSSVVVLVSSDPVFAASVEEQLRRSSYQSRTVASVTKLFEIIRHGLPVLVLVDRRIGDWDVLRTESTLSHVPILILIPPGVTGNDEDVIADLERGADGVYSCQDDHRLFLAVLGAYFRRTGHYLAQRGTYRVGGVELDADTREVSIAGQRMPLSAKRFGILQAFMSAPSRILTRGELLDLVWGPGFAIGEHTLDVHIHVLRRLLNQGEDHRCRLIAIKGVGFKLKVLPPSMTAPVQAEGFSEASIAKSVLRVAAVPPPIVKTTSMTIPAKAREASLRMNSPRRRAPPFSRPAFVRRRHHAVSVE